MDFKVGDKVRIRDWGEMWSEFGATPGGNICISPARSFSIPTLCGKEFEVIEVVAYAFGDYHSVKLRGDSGVVHVWGEVVELLDAPKELGRDEIAEFLEGYK